MFFEINGTNVMWIAKCMCSIWGGGKGWQGEVAFAMRCRTRTKPLQNRSRTLESPIPTGSAFYSLLQIEIALSQLIPCNWRKDDFIRHCPHLWHLLRWQLMSEQLHFIRFSFKWPSQSYLTDVSTELNFTDKSDKNDKEQGKNQRCSTGIWNGLKYSRGRGKGNNKS